MKRALVAAVMTVIAACGGSDTAGTGATGGGSGEATGTTSGGGPVEQPAICEQYLGCVAVESPATLADLTEGYGSNGTCWEGDEETVTNCTTACRAGLLDLGSSSAEIACNECATSAHCLAPLPFCGGGVCVECKNDSNCTHPARPACANGACIECLYNSSCKDPAQPVCINGSCSAG